MTNEERTEFLKQTVYFKEVSLRRLEEIIPLLTESTLEPGETIIHKGLKGDSMYIICKGEVRIHDGDYTFSRLQEGEGFGSYYLIDHLERSASVTATRKTELLVMSEKLFDQFIRTDPEFSTGILRVLVKQLRKMNEIEGELTSLNATKDKFFSIIAHDLRSPLSTIISFAGLLKDSRGTLSEEQISEIIKSQYDVSWQSLKLLDNLLKWAQVQTGRLTPNPEFFDLLELVSEVIDFSTPSAEAKRISLKADIPNALEVFADMDMVRTVLINLTNNAIKFTGRGGSVTVHGEKTKYTAMIAISDTGTGIPEDRLETLFQLGKSVSTAGTEQERGTGLGLILCKEFVEKNGGSITATSTPGIGSTFMITLPLNKPE